MSVKRSKISSTKLPKGATVLSGESVARFSRRINEAMKEVNRTFQKKQKVSADKASQIVLNA